MVKTARTLSLRMTTADPAEGGAQVKRAKNLRAAKTAQASATKPRLAREPKAKKSRLTQKVDIDATMQVAQADEGARTIDGPEPDDAEAVETIDEGRTDTHR